MIDRKTLRLSAALLVVGFILYVLVLILAWIIWIVVVGWWAKET